MCPGIHAVGFASSGRSHLSGHAPGCATSAGALGYVLRDATSARRQRQATLGSILGQCGWMAPPGFLDRTFIDVPCPRCGYPVEVQILDIRLQSRVFCPSCKVGIQLIDEGASTDVGLRQIDSALEDLNKMIERMGR